MKSAAATTVLLVLPLVAPVASACDPAHPLLITEFMAANGGSLLDEDGDASDWIEVYNACLPEADLQGWFLTDDPAQPAKWRFPAVRLARGEFLLVYASGKDRAVAGATLHANFKLAAEGEYLALVEPDGATVAHAFGPAYPPQFEDVSCGLPQRAASLLERGTPARYRVPGPDDAATGTAWTDPSWDDSGWSAGPTGLGFTASGPPGFAVTVAKATSTVGDLATAEAVLADPLLQAWTATESAPVVNHRNTGGSAHYGSDRPFPGTTFSQDVDDLVMEATATVLLPEAGPWTFGVNSDDGFSLQLERASTTFTLSYPSPRAPGDTLGVFQVPEPGAYRLRLVFYERGGGSEVELFAARGSLGAWSSAFALVGDAAAGGLALADLSGLVATDVGSAMRGANASLWTRLQFEVADPATLDLLHLRMRHEDGYVAFLNGTEVAADRAPAPLAWDSASTGDKPDEEAGIPRGADLTGAIPLLATGTNVLSVQGLNDALDDPDFLVLPELDAAEETDPGAPPAYFPSPTPGAFNATGYPGVSGSPSFSRGHALFADPFSLSLSATAPGAVIRYTTDGSIPAEDHGTVYADPLPVSESARIRARVFEEGLAPGPVLTRMYARLGPDVAGVTSDLPLVVVHTFGGGVNQTWLTESLTAVLSGAPGRTALSGTPSFVGPAGLRIRGSSSAGFPKKQYVLETWDETGDDLPVPLLGMPEESDWVLFGPYNDKTLLRDVLAYRWSNAIGRYAPRTAFVEAYLRTAAGPVSASDYVGVYVLIEKIKRDPARVNVAEILPTDSVPPRVSGGYITKKDRLDPGDSGFLTSRGQRLCFVEPKEDEITEPQASYLEGYYGGFETALYGPDFADPAAGYAAWIDPDAWIDHWWLVEMVKNIDGFRLSTFMFKDRDGRLAMGPIWDENLTLGNADYLEGWLPQGWYHDLLGAGDYPWWPRLFEDPEFALRAWDRWFALRRDPWRTDRLLADVEAVAAGLQESQARNFQRWPVLGVDLWPNWFVGRTWREELDWMEDWLETRLAWIDGRHAPPPSFSPPPGPVPLWSEVTIAASTGTILYTADGTDPRLPGGGISPSALPWSGPVVLEGTTRLRARTLDGATWSAENDGTWETLPAAVVNEVLPVNLTVLADEQGEFEPWIELYNPLVQSADLSGLGLSDDPALPGRWTLPQGTRLCGHERMVVWADGETAEGPLHASFRLPAGGGTVLLHDARGRPLDVLAYPALPQNASYGRTPDGGETLATFLYATPGGANSTAVTRLLVNEYNAVAPDRMLAGTSSDPFWGRVLGNGGDWFELVVVQDHLDLRGWRAEVQDGLVPATTTLVFGQEEALADLRSGTLVTVAENLVSDASYDPAAGDWWINLRSGPGGDGVYVTAADFNTSQQNTRITLYDDAGALAFGPMGEGVNPASGVGNDEVLKLEADPGPSSTAFSPYRDGTTSTFGSPNRWGGGTVAQDLGPLRSVVPGPCAAGDPCDDDNPCTDDACADGRCRNVPNAAPCDDGDPCTSGDACNSRQCRGAAAAGCCLSDCACDDGVACTLDACDAFSCGHVADAEACDDGDLCTDDRCDPAQGCGNDANGTCSVSGTVRYYRDGATHAEPGTHTVPGISVSCAGGPGAGATTDAAGTYVLPGLWGAVTVQGLGRWGDPRADDGGAITSFDAVLASRHAVGLDPLTPHQALAADVSGNGEVTAFDAARVAQYAVELADHFEVAAAAGSDWHLLRCDPGGACTAPVYVHASLAGPVVDDFRAVLYGDASGNWGPGGSRAAASDEDRAHAEDRAEADRRRAAGPVEPVPASAGAVLTLSGWRPARPAGSMQEILVRVEGGEGMTSLDLGLAVDPDLLTVLDARTTGAGAAFRLARNLEPGRARLALYGPDPLRGPGDLLVLTVRVERPGAPAPVPTVAARIDEGRIPVRVRVVP